MRSLIRVVSLALVCFGTFISESVVANVAPAGASQTPAGRERVRSQLSNYFKDIQRNSPTVLGGLAKSPDAMAAIQERIARMDDAELTRFQKLMAETPDWKVAPEAFAGAFPPEVLNQVRAVGADYAAQVPKGKIMRDDVRSLVSVLRMLPEGKFKELGIDRKMIESLDATFAGMTPLQLAILQKRVDESSPWREKSAAALQSIPPALERGAAALADHGPLTEKDVRELSVFRAELLGLLNRLDKLPPEARKKFKQLDSSTFAAQLEQLNQASPDVLFMMRHTMPQEMLPALRRNVAFLERVSTFSKEESADLERFRGSLTQAFRQVKAEGQGEWQGADEMMAKLGPEHLFILQKRMESLGGWQAGLPAVYQTLAAPETASRLRAIQGLTPDPVAVLALNSFRQQALSYIEAVGPTSGLTPAFLASARKTVETVPLDRLELIRMATERLPASASAADRLSIVAMSALDFGCSVSVQAFPEICVGGCAEVCVPLLGCAEVCVPRVCTPAVVVTADFDFICNPIKTALRNVEAGITTSGNAAVETMRAGIQTSIDGVRNSINASVASVQNVVDTSVSAITKTVDDIFAFAKTIPDLAWKAIKLALDLLLDLPIKNGVTLRSLVAQGPEVALNSMKTLMGLAGDWWTAISSFTLPAIPCPPAGFHTPFGDVGEGSTANNYARYRLMIDGIIGMIPDTEVSLAIKVPAQVTFMLFDFLGTCLTQAASDADAAELTTRHTLVLANFGTMRTFVTSQIAGLSTAATNQSGGLLTLLTTENNNARALVLSQSQATQTVVNTESTTVQNLIKTDSTELRSLVQLENDATQSDIKSFRELDLRVTIERVLQAGTGDEVASFQLLEPAGHLRLVSTIVEDTIRSMIVAQEGVGQAQKYFDSAVLLMNGGKYKSAFREFIKAYRETTK